MVFMIFFLLNYGMMLHDVAVVMPHQVLSSAVPRIPSAPDLSLRVSASHLGPVHHSHPEVALLGAGFIGIDHLRVPRCQSRSHVC